MSNLNETGTKIMQMASETGAPAKLATAVGAAIIEIDKRLEAIERALKVVPGSVPPAAGKGPSYSKR
jgi:hypothetical protein